MAHLGQRTRERLNAATPTHAVVVDRGEEDDVGIFSGQTNQRLSEQDHKTRKLTPTLQTALDAALAIPARRV